MSGAQHRRGGDPHDALVRFKHDALRYRRRCRQLELALAPVARIFAGDREQALRKIGGADFRATVSLVSGISEAEMQKWLNDVDGLLKSRVT